LRFDDKRLVLGGFGAALVFFWKKTKRLWPFAHAAYGVMVSGLLTIIIKKWLKSWLFGLSFIDRRKQQCLE